MNLDVRKSLTFAVFLLLAGACGAAQRQTLHDVLDGVHAVCEGADPAMHLILQRGDAGKLDGGRSAQ